MKKKWMRTFGAVTDHPLTMIDLAIEEATAATGEEHDNLPMRRAADTAWLAAASTADVAASKLGLGIPKGTNGRVAVLEKVEKSYKLRTGILGGKFNAAHATLHSLCYYENSPSADKRAVLWAMEETREMIRLTLDVIERRPKVPVKR